MKILLPFAFCLFVIGTFWNPYGTVAAGQPWYTGRIGFNPISAGLACWVGSLIL
jgi:hypothetical protein